MSKGIQVLAWPAFKRATLSLHNALLYKGMQELGATVDDFTAWRVLSGRYDIVHFHWPEYCVNSRGLISAVFWSSALFVAMCWVRVCGGKVVWTVHNLESHDQQHPRAERMFWKIFTSLLNGYIALTNLGAEQARRRHPALRTKLGFVIPHGNIRDAYSNSDISREQARSKLGIRASAKVIGFFGHVELYKGVTELVETFSALPGKDAVLLVAGKSSLPSAEQKSIDDIAAKDTRVVLRLEYIPPEEVTSYIRACDLMVLPFREILNSGSALLAASLDRPVLVPDKSTMRELQQFAGSEWVRLYSGDLTAEVLQKEMNAAAEGAAQRGRCRALEVGWQGLDWRALAQLTLDAYRSVIGNIPRWRATVTKPTDSIAPEH